MAENNCETCGCKIGLTFEVERLEIKLDEAYEVLNKIYDSGLQLQELEGPVRKILRLAPLA